MRRVILAVPALLMACGSWGPLTPRAVTLRDDALAVRFSDGQVCRAMRPGAALNWSGTFDGCGGYSFAVELEQGTNPLRWLVEQVFAPAGGAPLLALGQVTLTDPVSGRVHVFVSPPAEAED